MVLPHVGKEAVCPVGVAVGKTMEGNVAPVPPQDVDEGAPVPPRQDVDEGAPVPPLDVGEGAVEGKGGVEGEGGVQDVDKGEVGGVGDLGVCMNEYWQVYQEE